MQTLVDEKLTYILYFVFHTLVQAGLT